MNSPAETFDILMYLLRWYLVHSRKSYKDLVSSTFPKIKKPFKFPKRGTLWLDAHNRACWSQASPLLACKKRKSA